MLAISPRRRDAAGAGLFETIQLRRGLGSGECLRIRRESISDGLRFVAARTRIVHVHAKDCHMEGRQAGLGSARDAGDRLEGTDRGLVKDGYKGYLSLETHWAGPGGDKLQASKICGWNLTRVWRATRMKGTTDMQHQNLAPIEFFARLFLALGLGALIGLERQLRNHEGRTEDERAGGDGIGHVRHDGRRFDDPDRIVAQILPGIGFLGAGMIMRDGLHVRGLNTAATIWCSAAIGTLVGVGERAMPALAAVTVVVANVVLRELAVWIDKKHAASGVKEGAATGPMRAEKGR